MKKKLIYRNERRIEEMLNGYCGYWDSARKLQSVIDELATLGIPLADNCLRDLYDGGSATTQATEALIEEEVAKMTFQASKDDLRERLRPLPYKIDDYVRKVRDITSERTFTPIEHYVDKDLKVDLIDGLEQIITNENSVYADSEMMAEVYERAQRLEKEINSFNDFLRQQGDYVIAAGKTVTLIVERPTLVQIDEDGKATIDTEAFASVTAKRRIPR